MPQFAHKSDIFEAIQFDGSAASALECAQKIGHRAKISVIDGNPVLKIGRKPVACGEWIAFRREIGIVEPGAFADYVEIAPKGEAPKPAKPALAPLATLALARQDSGISEGDVVRPANGGEEMEVLDIRDGNAECDSVWGVKVIPVADLVFVRKAA